MTEKKAVDSRHKLNDRVQESICQSLRVGCYIETAAAMAGINVSTIHVWLRRGAAELRRRELYDLDLEARVIKDRELRKLRKLSAHEKKLRRAKIESNKRIKKREQMYVDFHLAVERAMAQGEMHDLGIISNSARGGHVIERKVIKEKNGAETVIEKHAPPQWQAAAWKLERRNPKRWARTQRMEIRAEDLSGDSNEEGASTWADAVKEAYKRRDKRREERMNDNDDRKDMHMLPETDGSAKVPDEVLTATDVGEA